MPCGSLSFAASDVKSRRRNHHVTLLAEPKSGPALFVVGGFDGSSTLANVDRHAIGKDGALAAGTDAPALPVAVGGLTGATVGNVLVVAGGTKGTLVTDTAFSAVVGDDGTLGAWKDAGTVGQPRMHPGAVAKDDTIWVMGGFIHPVVWDDVVSAKVSPDGTVSAWSPAGKLPGKRSHFAITRVGDYVYLSGGLDASALTNPPDLKDTFVGHLAADGTLGEWQSGPPLPVGLATHSSFFYGGYLYVGGGISDSPPKQEFRMWRSPIASDHSMGAWEETTALPVARGHVHDFPVFENHVYSVAGAINFNLASTDEIDVGTFE
jgi:hypothetical protein